MVKPTLKLGTLNNQSALNLFNTDLATLVEEVRQKRETMEITYATLLLYLENSYLEPNQFYLITDYKTKYLMPYTDEIHEGEVEPLLILTLSSNVISNFVYSLSHPTDYIKYDITSNICEDGITPRTGKIIYREDKNHNSTYYDFRNVKFRRWTIDAEEWQDDQVYASERLLKYNNVLYKFGAANIASSSTIGVNPTIDKRWIKYLDVSTDKYVAPFMISQLYNHSFPGGVIPAGIIHPKHKDFYTFSNADGEEKSEWFSNCRLDGFEKIILVSATEEPIVVLDSPYNNIVFQENAGDKSHNNNFENMSGNMTFQSNTTNNTFGAATINNIFDENTLNNYLLGWRYNINGPDCTENTCVMRLWLGNNMGQGFTGNTIGGEGVWNNIDIAFLQNNTTQDFTCNVVGSGFHYNNCACDMWDNLIGNNVQDNTFTNLFKGNIVGAETTNCFFLPSTTNNTFPDYMYAANVQIGENANLNFTNAEALIVLSGFFSKRVFGGSDGGAYIEYFDGTNYIVVPASINSAQTSFAYIITELLTQYLYVGFNKQIQTVAAGTKFNIKLDNSNYTVGSGTIQTNPFIVKFLINSPIIKGEPLILSYSTTSGTLTFTDLSTLTNFDWVPIFNRVE